MNESTTAAIMAGVSAYIQQEELVKAHVAAITARPQMSPWRLFGRQQLIRSRTNWRTKKASR